MPVIAVINRKGGSGKSTLATHLAAYCATHGMPVMLGDVDRQQSARTWLRRRESRKTLQPSPIVGWAVDPKNVLRPPAGITRVILDTPGGMRDFDLARVVMSADAILMPVCNSSFDRESAAECFAELMRLPRVSSGRCKVAAIGMRLDARTKGAEVLQAWAEKHKLPFIGVLRETQAYVRCIEQGLTLFDLPAAQVQSDMAQWQPILDWLAPVLTPAEPAAELAATRPVVKPAPMKPAAAKPAGPMVTSTTSTTSATPAARSQARDLPADGHRLGGLLGWLPGLRFLQRKPRSNPFAASIL
jgi:chromosome partitioning protein